ncbi:MAG: MBL fold metallo-hydrolase [Flavobacteriales bacterium]|nr:MBL fold metallo-hydrolase [Flavobacteriales bacterium]
MRIEVIHAGNFKLDGGAMFGVVPKSIWNRINPADDNNMCNWAMRCLLVEDGNRRILIDTGIGDKQSEKFFGYYYLNGDHSLKNSLNAAGLDFSDITDVLLTHLHFDHCGGAIKWDAKKEKLLPAFPNAKYWTHREHWDHALNPNVREKPSFLIENILPIQESGQLHFLGDSLQFSDNIDYRIAGGHTEKMICPIIRYKNRTIVYMADMIPSSGHIPINFIMSYDIRPLQVMEEKEDFLKKAAEENLLLFFEHDLNIECAEVHSTEKGIRMSHNGHLSQFIDL